MLCLNPHFEREIYGLCSVGCGQRVISGDSYCYAFVLHNYSQYCRLIYTFFSEDYQLISNISTFFFAFPPPPPPPPPQIPVLLAIGVTSSYCWLKLLISFFNITRLFLLFLTTITNTSSEPAFHSFPLCMQQQSDMQNSNTCRGKVRALSSPVTLEKTSNLE